ncbi:hypothetical protein G6F55_007713 [Rhizopus delemar]|uniref:Twinfilin n=2 Tax=Rhizopus TaxID=4842 RepID=A0A9P7CMC2_9FUNG|nr:hypothetical protein G6F43_006823 [Rhizopus delemar]KAG1540428.1 hypothetical protein G6F51_008532 [Rhizopus arrhizus]KAG1454243.1 hypothetical protein G6F55_007713 [Rhizopus delemar]KAG1519884.1 hypothetical protein G6F52_008189 [Rhizopus delemar]KAG1566964.1 hypothetical protein G6F50_008645 [Rhizopus delemar]
MSTQSGIQVSEELSKVFTDAVSSGNVRILRVSIVNESLVPNGTTPVQDDFERDYQHVSQYLEDTIPAYVFVRLDEKSTTGEYNWLFLCYVPDKAKIRDKMLYASTRATLTKELGDYRFADQVYGTDKSEFTWDGYRKHLAHKSADAPLTRREQELAEIKAAEAKAVSDYQGTTTRKSYAPGVAFPLTEKAIESLLELKKEKQERTCNFVSLHLDSEKVDVDNLSHVPIKELQKAISANSPRFTFYIFDDGSKESLVFIYTCPSTSKIRERMLYSSSKSSVISAAETDASIQVVKKFETSDLEDLTEDYFSEELNAVSSSTSNSSGSVVGDRINMLGGTKQGFKRPVAPGRRRPGTTSTA